MALHSLALCAGVGGLDLGVKLARPDHKLSLRGSRASRTRSQVSAGEPRTSGGYGLTSGGLFATYSPGSSSWRTCQGSLPLPGLEPYSVTWPRAGGVSNGNAYLRKVSEPLTDATGFSSLLPTPTAAECHGEWARNRSDSAGAALRPLLPTPTARDWKGATAPTKSGNLAGEVGATGDRLRLNPRFVEWMMGLAVDWTRIG